MARKYIDCREYPSETNCSIALSADNEKELLEAAVQHAVAVLGGIADPQDAAGVGVGDRIVLQPLPKGPMGRTAELSGTRTHECAA